MRIISPYVELAEEIDGKEVLKKIEKCGRVCYKSEDKITDGSAEKFVKNIIDRGHEAVLEHASVSVKIICDRAVSHEIVRHRVASFCQESTRYCNYTKDKFGEEITVIKPLMFDEFTPAYNMWKRSCENAEVAYFDLLREGYKPQDARSVLPNSLKTEIVMTANLREWRHFLKLRISEAAHPQMREIAYKILLLLYDKISVVFEDIWGECNA